jgi:hypothetical protein
MTRARMSVSDGPLRRNVRRCEREPTRFAPNADKTDLAFLHDLVAIRFPTRREPDVAAPQGGMARERELPLRREDANAIIRPGHPWLQEKEPLFANRLALIPRQWTALFRVPRAQGRGQRDTAENPGLGGLPAS